MPQIIFAARKGGHHDGSIGKQIYNFMRKLSEDDTLPGLHIEPIQGAIDRKVRTGRVNDMYRAVLFKLDAGRGEPTYVFAGVWPHDEAIRIATRAVLRTNPVNGVSELVLDPTDATDAPPVAAPAAAETHETGPSSLLADQRDVSADRLVRKLGIDRDLAERAMAATTEDELLALVEHAVEWQADALLSLAAGETIDDVRTRLELDRVPEVAPDASEAERLLAGFRTPTAQMQFVWLEDDKELRRVIESGDFDRWRVFLHPEQRRYAHRSYRGSFRLTGGAGTGKTVVLVHRAAALARRDASARVVLTTFTRTLADALRHNLRVLDPGLPLARSLGEPGISVASVDAAANAVLRAASSGDAGAAAARVLGVAGSRDLGGRTDERAAWRDAIDAVGDRLPADLRSPAFFADEYAYVVLPNRITTRDEYLRARRTGRGVALGRQQRAAVWDVVEAYRAGTAVEGTIDFSEVAAIAAELAAAGTVPRADHVLVDEGQDLTPVQWQLLRALVPEGQDDLFIAEDAQQRIYGQRVVLGRYGIRIVGRSRRLALNYRTTAQVLRFATGVLAGETYVDLDDEVADSRGFRSARSGPAPRMIAARSLSDELVEAARLLRGWLDGGVEPETIGVLVRDQQLLATVDRGLRDRGVAVKPVGRDGAARGAPQLMTMHRAKGMEFSRVLILGVDADLVPADYLLRGVPEGDRDDLLQRERSLFYVAATRARDELVVMWQGEGSAFLPSRRRAQPAGAAAERA